MYLLEQTDIDVQLKVGDGLISMVSTRGILAGNARIVCTHNFPGVCLIKIFIIKMQELLD